MARRRYPPVRLATHDARAWQVSQWPKPGRLSSRFDCLSARFSFNDLLGFLEFGFFGDLSPMALLLPGVGRGVQTGFAGCRAQRSNLPIVMLDAEPRCVTTGVVCRHMPSTEARPPSSTVPWIVEDHAATISG